MRMQHVIFSEISYYGKNVLVSQNDTWQHSNGISLCVKIPCRLVGNIEHHTASSDDRKEKNWGESLFLALVLKARPIVAHLRLLSVSFSLNVTAFFNWIRGLAPLARKVYSIPFKLLIIKGDHFTANKYSLCSWISNIFISLNYWGTLLLWGHCLLCAPYILCSEALQIHSSCKIYSVTNVLALFSMNVPVDFHIRYIAPSLRCPLHSILISHPKCHS